MTISRQNEITLRTLHIILAEEDVCSKIPNRFVYDVLPCKRGTRVSRRTHVETEHAHGRLRNRAEQLAAACTPSVLGAGPLAFVFSGRRAKPQACWQPSGGISEWYTCVCRR